ncbi:hypothetical protein L1887_57571 [Cichorium endivia]|nr:hypothetical protein L1887_57571 [Cichorium endivia]
MQRRARDTRRAHRGSSPERRSLRAKKGTSRRRERIQSAFWGGDDGDRVQNMVNFGRFDPLSQPPRRGARTGIEACPRGGEGAVSDATRLCSIAQKSPPSKCRARPSRTIGIGQHMDCIKRSDPAVMACLLGSLGHLGERGEGVLVSQVDRGAVATATTAATATGSTTLATGGAAAAATGQPPRPPRWTGGLVEGLLDLEHLLALLLGAGLGLLRLGRGKVVGLLLLVLGQLGPGRLVAGDLTGSLGLDVELLAGLGSEVLVEGHGLVLLLLGHLLGLGGGEQRAASVGALSLGVGLGLLLGVELLLRHPHHPSPGRPASASRHGRSASDGRRHGLGARHGRGRRGHHGHGSRRCGHGRYGRPSAARPRRRQRRERGERCSWRGHGAGCRHRGCCAGAGQQQRGRRPWGQPWGRRRPRRRLIWEERSHTERISFVR